MCLGFVRRGLWTGPRPTGRLLCWGGWVSNRPFNLPNSLETEGWKWNTLLLGICVHNEQQASLDAQPMFFPLSWDAFRKMKFCWILARAHYPKFEFQLSKTRLRHIIWESDPLLAFECANKMSSRGQRKMPTPPCAPKVIQDHQASLLLRELSCAISSTTEWRDKPNGTAALPTDPPCSFQAPFALRVTITLKMCWI